MCPSAISTCASGKMDIWCGFNCVDLDQRMLSLLGIWVLLPVCCLHCLLGQIPSVVPAVPSPFFGLLISLNSSIGKSSTLSGSILLLTEVCCPKPKLKSSEDWISTLFSSISLFTLEGHSTSLGFNQLRISRRSVPALFSF